MSTAYQTHKSTPAGKAQTIARRQIRAGKYYPVPVTGLY